MMTKREFNTYVRHGYSMKKIHMLLLSVLFLSIPLHAWAFDPFLIKNSDEVAPDFAFYTLEDKLVKSSELKGHIILLFFWMTTCKPCITEMTEVEKLHKKYKDHSNVSIYVVNSGFEPLEKVHAFLEKKWNISYKTGPENPKMDLAFAYDPGSRNFKLFNLFAHPSVVMIDQKNMIRMKHTGYTKHLFTRFNAFIEKLLSEGSQAG